jgi:hypothetical protein
MHKSFVVSRHKIPQREFLGNRQADTHSYLHQVRHERLGGRVTSSRENGRGSGIERHSLQSILTLGLQDIDDCPPLN